MRLYNLTPLGEHWGWGSRLLEITGQTLALVFVVPVVYAHHVTGKVLEKLLA